MTYQTPGIPSRNPTIDGHLRTVLRFVFGKLVQNSLDDMLPAEVISFDRATNLVTVQPLISMLTTANEVIPRSQLVNLPIAQIGAGGFVLNFPLKKGDLGFIKSNDRDISLFTQFWRMVRPNTLRMHSFEDSIFIPTVMTGFSIAGSDSANVVLQLVDGSFRFSLGAGNGCITDQNGYEQSLSSVLDVQSITRALKIPSMTTGQRDAIASPIGGMMVYCHDVPKYSFYTDGTGWS